MGQSGGVRARRKEWISCFSLDLLEAQPGPGPLLAPVWGTASTWAHCPWEYTQQTQHWWLDFYFTFLKKEFRARSPSDAISIYAQNKPTIFSSTLHSLLKAELDLWVIVTPLEMAISIFKKEKKNTVDLYKSLEFQVSKYLKKVKYFT